MTEKEKRKLGPIINAADSMAVKMEQIAAEDDFQDSKGKTDAQLLSADKGAGRQSE